MISVSVSIVKSRRCLKQETDAEQVTLRSISPKNRPKLHISESAIPWWTLLAEVEIRGCEQSPVMAESLIHRGLAVTSSDFPNDWNATLLDFVGFWPESIHLETGFR